MKPFVDWSRNGDPDFDREELRPRVRRYWQLGPPAKDRAIASFVGGDPALVEKGRAILFTSPLDRRFLAGDNTKEWNNYWNDSAFGMILVDRVCRYLGGEVNIPELNFTCGQVPHVDLPAGLLSPLTLSGPGLSGVEKTLQDARSRGAALLLPQATTPGNYVVLDAKERPVAGVSVTLPARETILERVPLDELEAALGKGAVVRPGQGLSLSDLLRQTRPSPIELLPAMMIALLVFLTVESLLANRFYKRPAAEELTIRQLTAPLTAKGNP